MLVLLMYTLLSIFGARLSNSVPKKGRDPSRSISMVNFHGKTLSNTVNFRCITEGTSMTP